MKETHLQDVTNDLIETALCSRADNTCINFGWKKTIENNEMDDDFIAYKFLITNLLSIIAYKILIIF